MGRGPPPDNRNRPHTLADHLLGALADHVHDGDEHDHDHDHGEMEGLLHPGEAGHVALTSIGIDIGSSGTQIAFARLVPEHSATGHAAAGRETLYQSPVALTPFGPDDTIDEHALGAILDAAFEAAAIHPDDIDCGVVILTGLARERRNAEAIARRLATDCGDIVSASAGHHMEARLAAHGSGAVARSAASGRGFLNIDIGGGTTKLAVCKAGRILATAALDIGGRLAAHDESGRLMRLSPAGRELARHAGLDWRIGTMVTPEEVTRVGEQMADDLISALTCRPLPMGTSETINRLYLTTALDPLLLQPASDDNSLGGGIAGMIVSGGVGEYVYGREHRTFGDLGKALGLALAARIDQGRLPWPLMPATHCIRATVLGASSYTVQLSGRTSWLPNPAALLPRRNMQVLQPELDLSGAIRASSVATSIAAHLNAFGVVTDGDDIAIALSWCGSPDYARLRALAEGLAEGLAPRIAAGRPVYIILDGDIARSLGAILSEEIGLGVDLAVLDGIGLADFDFIDLGRIRLPSQTVPVTIKTLVFRRDQVQKRRQPNR